MKIFTKNKKVTFPAILKPAETESTTHKSSKFY